MAPLSYTFWFEGNSLLPITNARLYNMWIEGNCYTFEILTLSPQPPASLSGPSTFIFPIV